ncbi:hypothetical protein Agub_g5631 [Astrephomene gubernaculifera]|uniref:Large ribosomal subunit protein uL11c n=1 Tax=Astrephomene gubernaculifera TaxID=47775 RepID=A0AAD3DM44_9CHLO|nr:hypothetical protein Agub_g5631 [Astrephomene gubernaculifera]
MAAAMPVSGSGVRLPTRTLSAASTSRMAFGFPSVSRTPTRSVTTMAAKVTGKIKLALPAGKANPAPPVGPALGSKGVNIMAFCKQYNAETAKMIGDIIPVEITVYEDRSFTFILKTPPASILLKKAAGIERGAGKPNKEVLGQVTRKQVAEIAAKKLPDTNATQLESVARMIEGTAKNMGIKVVD